MLKFGMTKVGRLLLLGNLMLAFPAMNGCDHVRSEELNTVAGYFNSSGKPELYDCFPSAHSKKHGKILLHCMDEGFKIVDVKTGISEVIKSEGIDALAKPFVHEREGVTYAAYTSKSSYSVVKWVNLKDGVSFNQTAKFGDYQDGVSDYITLYLNAGSGCAVTGHTVSDQFPYVIGALKVYSFSFDPKSKSIDLSLAFSVPATISSGGMPWSLASDAMASPESSSLTCVRENGEIILYYSVANSSVGNSEPGGRVYRVSQRGSEIVYTGPQTVFFPPVRAPFEGAYALDQTDAGVLFLGGGASNTKRILGTEGRRWFDFDPTVNAGLASAETGLWRADNEQRRFCIFDLNRKACSDEFPSVAAAPENGLGIGSIGLAGDGFVLRSYGIHLPFLPTGAGDAVDVNASNFWF